MLHGSQISSSINSCDILLSFESLFSILVSDLKCYLLRFIILTLIVFIFHFLYTFCGSSCSVSFLWVTSLVLSTCSLKRKCTLWFYSLSSTYMFPLTHHHPFFNLHPRPCSSSPCQLFKYWSFIHIFHAPSTTIIILFLLPSPTQDLQSFTIFFYAFLSTCYSPHLLLLPST